MTGGDDTRAESVHVKSYPQASYEETNQKMSRANKRDFASARQFRALFSQVRWLTVEEEEAVGKLCKIGKQLREIKRKLVKISQGEVSREAWASACGLSVDQLDQYLLGSERARSFLVRHNLQLADSVTRGLLLTAYHARDISYLELLAEAVSGLVQASQGFDGRGRFSTYAVPFIRSALFQGITKLRPGSYLPHQSIMLYYRVRRAEKSLAMALKREPTLEELARATKLPLPTVRFLIERIAAKKTAVSVYDKMPCTRPSDYVVPYVDVALRPQEHPLARRQLASLAQAVNLQVLMTSLTPTEQRVLRLRYGLDGNEERSIDRVAALMCVGPEEIRRITLRALEKLRNVTEFSNGILDMNNIDSEEESRAVLTLQ
eukprot:scaffold1160_cov174-Ochromonas_danica.AAC.35